MKSTTRKILADYASGTGIPLREVKRKYDGLPESQRFAVLAAMRNLERQHAEYLKSGKLPEKPVVLYGADGSELVLPGSGPDADVVPIR